MVIATVNSLSIAIGFAKLAKEDVSTPHEYI